MGSLNDVDEWYTPHNIIDLVKQVMGSIDLDPASTPAANKYIEASKYHTIDDDGLSKPWYGKVFCNPPYNGSAPEWSRKWDKECSVFADVEEAMLLVNANLGYNWFNDLFYEPEYKCCLIKQRLHFIPAGGQTDDIAKRASAMFYYGPHKRKFANVFGEIGKVV